MSKLLVQDADLAEKLHKVAAKGFNGTPTDLAAKLQLAPINATVLGRLRGAALTMADDLRSVGVDISQLRRGNNTYLSINKLEGYTSKQKFDSIVPLDAPLPADILGLEAEILHLRSERDSERRKNKEVTKSAGLFSAIVEEMDERITPFRNLPPARPLKKVAKPILEHAVLHLSDMHADEVVTLEDTCGLEEYNFNIACARAEKLVDTTIEWTQETLGNNFEFSDLWILANGDATSGEIHGHGHRSYYRNQFKCCFAIGQLQALMLRDLAPHFPRVHVVCLSGNHGRRTTTKDYNGAHDNFDYLISQVTRMHCRGIENIEFLIPDSFSVNLDINGNGFHVEHGDDVRSNGGVPFYALTRRQKSLIALGAMTGGPRLRYFCLGHHHVSSALADADGEMLINGSFIGTSAYSYNSFAGYREPCQLLHGVHARHGVSWRLPIKVKHAEESKGPKRYKIDGGRDIGPLPL